MTGGGGEASSAHIGPCMLNLSFHGAAGEVTGSCYLVRTDQARVLVDFGMFQGGRDAARRNQRAPLIKPRGLDAVVLTHAHLDHCGRLPLLVQAGYEGKIHATYATCSLTQIILRDSASIQEMDAARENRHRMRQDRAPVAPLYTSKDVAQVFRLFAPMHYEEQREIAPGVSIRLVDAGHILGSASVEMRVRESARAGARELTIVFSGDIGVKGSPLLRDPVQFPRADVLVLESTYGDRDHRARAETVAELRGVLERARAEDGKVLIPAFAVGRTQDLIYHFGGFARAKGARAVQVYIDSPMALEATALYRRHPHLFDEETTRLSREGHALLDFAGLHAVRTPQQSQRLNALRGGGVVIAGSGMCTGGRIMHHLRHSLWQPTTHVVFVGYQGKGTLGREIVDGAKNVRVFEEPIAVKAQVHTLGGFSAHAGQTELVEWASSLASAGPRVFLTHGEEPQRRALARELRRTLRLKSHFPSIDQTVAL